MLGKPLFPPGARHLAGCPAWAQLWPGALRPRPSCGLWRLGWFSSSCYCSLSVTWPISLSTSAEPCSGKHTVLCAPWAEGHRPVPGESDTCCEQAALGQSVAPTCSSSCSYPPTPPPELGGNADSQAPRNRNRNSKDKAQRCLVMSPQGWCCWCPSARRLEHRGPCLITFSCLQQMFTETQPSATPARWQAWGDLGKSNWACLLGWNMGLRPPSSEWLWELNEQWLIKHPDVCLELLRFIIVAPAPHNRGDLGPNESWPTCRPRREGTAQPREPASSANTSSLMAHGWLLARAPGWGRKHALTHQSRGERSLESAHTLSSDLLPKFTDGRRRLLVSCLSSNPSPEQNMEEKTQVLGDRLAAA